MKDEEPGAGNAGLEVIQLGQQESGPVPSLRQQARGVNVRVSRRRLLQVAALAGWGVSRPADAGAALRIVRDELRDWAGGRAG